MPSRPIKPDWCRCKKRPCLCAELSLWEAGIPYVAGVDEVGRGPLAGPVVAAAVILPPGLPSRRLAGVRDSKALTPLARARAVVRIRRHALAVGVGAASAGEIDRLGITVTVRLAMQRALARAQRRCEISHVLVDGHPVRELGFPQTAIIRGDHHCLSIAAASVIAKEVRDRLMRRLALRHPAFGWERNAGYGTRTHQQALREYGPTPHHRRSFGAQRELPW